MDTKIIQFDPKKTKQKKKNLMSVRQDLIIALKERLDLLLEQLVEIQKIIDDL